MSTSSSKTAPKASVIRFSSLLAQAHFSTSNIELQLMETLRRRLQAAFSILGAVRVADLQFHGSLQRPGVLCTSACGAAALFSFHFPVCTVPFVLYFVRFRCKLRVPFFAWRCPRTGKVRDQRAEREAFTAVPSRSPALPLLALSSSPALHFAALRAPSLELLVFLFDSVFHLSSSLVLLTGLFSRGARWGPRGLIVFLKHETAQTHYRGI